MNKGYTFHLALDTANSVAVLAHTTKHKQNRLIAVAFLPRQQLTFLIVGTASVFCVG